MSSKTKDKNEPTISTSSISGQSSEIADLPPDHPVHSIPLEKQEKMRKKGINPILRAEMDQMMNSGSKSQKFVKKWGATSMGPWMV